MRFQLYLYCCIVPGLTVSCVESVDLYDSFLTAISLPILLTATMTIITHMGTQICHNFSKRKRN